MYHLCCCDNLGEQNKGLFINLIFTDIWKGKKESTHLKGDTMEHKEFASCAQNVLYCISWIVLYGLYFMDCTLWIVFHGLYLMDCTSRIVFFHALHSMHCILCNFIWGEIED